MPDTRIASANDLQSRRITAANSSPVVARVSAPSFVGYNYRFLPTVQAVVKSALDGRLGKLRSIDLHVQESETFVRDGRGNRRIERVGAMNRAMNPECDGRRAPIGLVAEMVFHAHGPTL